MMARVIAAAKKTQTEVIKIISPSTSGAKLEACSGYNGSCDCTVLVCSLKIRLGADLAAPENPNPPEDEQNGQDAAQANNPENRGAVGAVRGIVVVTEEQDVIDRRANLSGGGVHQPQAHVAAGVFDAIEVARDAAVRSQEHHPAGVCE